MTAPRLAGALDDVTVDIGNLSARVRDRLVRAENLAELTQKLTAALYEVLHAGLRNEHSADAVYQRDRWLEAKFTAAVPHSRTSAEAVLRAVNEESQEILVELEGVLVWLSRSMARETPLGIDTLVKVHIPPVRPAVSPGFLLVDGTHRLSEADGLLRLYLHVREPEGAQDIWSSVLVALEAHGVPYKAKVLSRTSEYPRTDAIVVYLSQEHAAAENLVLAAISGAPGLGTHTSFFAEQRAEGIARAWEPIDSRAGMSGLSFGQHRARVVATALLDSARTGEPREPALVRAFLAARVDPANPASNTGPEGW